jgi:hypothetical protein
MEETGAGEKVGWAHRKFEWLGLGWALAGLSRLGEVLPLESLKRDARTL